MKKAHVLEGALVQLRGQGGLRYTLLQILVMIVVGITLGLLLAMPSGLTYASYLNVGVAALITFLDPLVGFLVWLFLSPFVSYLNVLVDPGAGLPAMTMGRVTIGLVLFILLAKVAIGRRSMPRPTDIGLWMGLSALTMGMAALTGTDLTGDLQSFVDRYLMPFLIYGAARYLIVDRRGLDWLLNVLIGLGTYCAVYGIYTQLTGNVYFVESDAEAVMYTASLRQMRGLLGTPDIFGQVFSFVIPIGFYRLIKEREPWKKQLYLLSLVLLSIGLFLTYKRAAWLGTLFSFVIIQWSYRQFRRLFLIGLVLALVIIGFAWNRVSESAVVTERLGYKAESLNGRTAYWAEALDLWIKQPVLGYGWDGFTRTSQWNNPIESTYLFILLSGGLVALLPYLMVLLLIVRDTIYLTKSADRRLYIDPELVVVFGGVLASFMVNIAVVNINSTVALSLIWALAGAIVGSQSSRIGNERRIRRAQRMRKKESSDAPSYAG